MFEPRITMITLGVADIAASTAFYQRLGFERSSTSNDTVTFFHTGGTVLGLFGREALAEDAGQEPTAKQGFEAVSLAHNLASPEAVDAAWAFAIECGAEPVKKARKSILGRLFGLFCRSRRPPLGAGTQSLRAIGREWPDELAGMMFGTAGFYWVIRSCGRNLGKSS
jgi:predicted lactoylglutathione lyase